MLDPITAAATASAAFNTIKKGFEIGRDIEQMAGDIGRWMSCLSDIEQAEKEAKNPPIFKKLFSGASAEQEALQIFIANKKAKEQREQLLKYLMARPYAEVAQLIAMIASLKSTEPNDKSKKDLS